jgi:glycosyltransferase involved in cell wall biosynthesis
MRILWFTNTPSLAIKKISNTYNVGGSWIESMERAMAHFKEVELGIAFPAKTDQLRQIDLEGSSTAYYMVPKYPIGQVGRFLKRITCSPEPLKVLDDYLSVVERFQPDIVHFFGTEATYTLIIPYLKVPSVIWFQGNLTVYRKKWQAGFPLWKAFLQEHLSDMLNGKTDLHKYLLFGKRVKGEQAIFKAAGNFIGRTDWDRRLVSIMAPQANYFHCEEPMRQPFFQAQWHPHKRREKLVLVSTIRENAYKGLETVFETAKLLGDVLDKPIEWRIVGIRPDSAYARIARKVARFSKADQSVQLLGFKSGQELVQEILAGDVYVHPSHIDNSPNSVCEAMLMGVPVVSTNVGGIPSLLLDKEEGLLVQNGDPYAMAGAILEIFNQPENARQMGLQARERGMSRNDTTRICSDLLGIYQNIIHQKQYSAVPN